MATTTKHIAVYCRVSSDKQNTASQKPELERWVAANDDGTTPVVWYEDTSNEHVQMDREWWKKLEAACQRGEVEKLVVWKLDRLGRNAAKLHELFNQLRQWGVGFVSLKDGFDLNTPVGRLIAGILASIAEWELEQNSMRIKAGLRRKRESGWKPKPKRKRTKLTPEKMATLKAMHKQGRTPTKIAESLGISRKHVYDVLGSLGASPNKPPKSGTSAAKGHRDLTENDIAILQRMIADDESKTKIAQVLGVSRQHVYRLISQHCEPDSPAASARPA